VLVVRVPADPSRHRVAVWRELRRAGAVSLGQGVWVVPDAPVFADGSPARSSWPSGATARWTVLDRGRTRRGGCGAAGGAVHRGAAEEWAEFIAGLCQVRR